MSEKKSNACQINGCNALLCDMSAYYRRYEICRYHASLPQHLLNGKWVRFCQQCGRFQPLEEFEGTKKTCRARLALHNAQRKKNREKVHGRRRCCKPRQRKQSQTQTEAEIIPHETYVKNQEQGTMSAEPFHQSYTNEGCLFSTDAAEDGDANSNSLGMCTRFDTSEDITLLSEWVEDVQSRMLGDFESPPNSEQFEDLQFPLTSVPPREKFCRLFPSLSSLPK